MSSFTENPGSFTKGNGPCDPPATPAVGSIKSYTQLIEAYENLSSTLAAHIASELPNAGANPHRGKDYVTDQLAGKQNTLSFDEVPTAGSSNPVKSKGIKSALDTGLAGKQDTLLYDNTPVEGSTKSLTSGAIYTAIANVLSLLSSDYQEKLTYDDVPVRNSTKMVKSGGIFSAINDLTIELKTFTSKFNVTADYVEAKKVLTSIEYILGKLHVQGIVDFTDWVTLSAQYAGINTSSTTESSGAYVLGMLSENWDNEDNSVPNNGYRSKSCRAMIKYINTYPLDAIVDAVVTYDGTKYTGSINVSIAHADDSWEDLAFHLVEGTDADGNKAIYLCISSSSFAYHPEEYPTLFRVCGINFIPASTMFGFLLPNNIGDSAQLPICSTACGNLTSVTAIKDIIATNIYINKMFSTTGNLAIEVLADGTVNFTKHPLLDGVEFASMTDVDAMIPVGAVLRWPGTTENVPDHFHYCDGSAIDNSSAFAKLAAILGVQEGNKIVLPVEDQAIIRTF